jgi:hypothetical protein
MGRHERVRDAESGRATSLVASCAAARRVLCDDGDLSNVGYVTMMACSAHTTRYRWSHKAYLLTGWGTLSGAAGGCRFDFVFDARG